ncbi:MAG: hypothetical protein NVSMB5_12160 [Candidatus Velthaea sp.]
MACARIGIGSNLGDAVRNVESAIARLGELGTVSARSSLYRTKAWGVTEQPDFLNAAALLETALEPHALLRELKRLEDDIGRVRTYRWGPRVIDLDILAYDDLVLETPELTIPHARLRERAFALAPLAEIDRGFAPMFDALDPAARAEATRVSPAGLPSYDDLPQAEGGARSGWGLFGEHDNIGLLNLITPERIAAATRLVRKGAVFPLGAPLDIISPPMFSRGIPRHTTIRTGNGRGLDDVIDNVYPQASSQWDSLGHISFDYKRYYNGASVDDVITGGRNTIDHWAKRGIAGRAVLIDLARTATFDPGTAHAFTVEDMERARAAAGITFEPGDIVLMHTGFLEWYARQDEATRVVIAPRDSLRAPGVEHTEAMARYLWNAHISAIASDNPSVEVWPADGRKDAWPFGFLHHILIGQFGMALGELWWLHDLAADCAADGVHEMLLTSTPINQRGGIGSPANALALK